MTRLDCYKSLKKENHSWRGLGRSLPSKPEQDSNLHRSRGRTFHTRNTMLMPELKYRVLMRYKEKGKTGKS